MPVCGKNDWIESFWKVSGTDQRGFVKNVGSGLLGKSGEQINGLNICFCYAMIILKTCVYEKLGLELLVGAPASSAAGAAPSEIYNC